MKNNQIYISQIEGKHEIEEKCKKYYELNQNKIIKIEDNIISEPNSSKNIIQNNLINKGNIDEYIKKIIENRINVHKEKLERLKNNYEAKFKIIKENIKIQNDDNKIYYKKHQDLQKIIEKLNGINDTHKDTLQNNNQNIYFK